MDLTVEDLRSELEKRGLDSEGDQEELQARFEEVLEKEKNEENTLETEDSTKKNPESEDTTDKEDVVQKEEMVATEEGEEDAETETEVDDKTDESEVQSLQTPSVEVASTIEEEEEEELKEEDVTIEEKETEEQEEEVMNEEEEELKEEDVTTEEKETEEEEVVNEEEEEEEKITEEKEELKEESSTSPPENANGTDDPAVADDSNDTTTETKDSTVDLAGTNAKSEENESFIVLVDDTQNDLDADLLSKEKATNKKSGAENAGSTTCKSGDGKDENASGAGGDKGKTADAKKTDKKVDEKKDGKTKSSTAVHRIKPKNVSGGNPNSCNLWISGLSSNTKATNLKAVFTKYGKVIGAKIVTNARSPGARCYGYLTMSSPDEAAKCIQHLNQTELHGRMISVERAKTNPGLQPIKKAKPALKSSDKPDGKKCVQDEKSPNKKSTTDKKTEERNSPTKKPAEKKTVAGKSSDKKPDKIESKKDGKSESEKGDSRSRKSRRSPSSKTKTPSKTSSRSPRSRDRSMGSSSRISDRKRRSHLERMMERQKQQIDHGRMVELELQRRQKKEAYMLEKLREELRIEKEKLERKRMRLETAKQTQMWKERQQQEMLNGFERERQPVKRPYERKAAHSYNFWEGPKRPNLGSSSRGGGAASGTSTSRFSSRTFSDETTWFSNHKETYDRRSDSYYNRDNKAMEPVTRFSDSNVGRINHAPQRTGHERYAPPESSSRLADHVSTDNRFERRDIGSGGYHGHNTDHRNLAADRGREIDRRSVTAHERLGGRRSQPAGGTNWKADNWSHSHAGNDNNHWVNSNMNSNYNSGTGGSGGFGGGSGTSSSGHGAQNIGSSSMYYNVGQQSGMMSAGGGNNMGSRMQETRYDAYKNLEHGGMRRY